MIVSVFVCRLNPCFIISSLMKSSVLLRPTQRTSSTTATVRRPKGLALTRVLTQKQIKARQRKKVPPMRRVHRLRALNLQRWHHQTRPRPLKNNPFRDACSFLHNHEAYGIQNTSCSSPSGRNRSSQSCYVHQPFVYIVCAFLLHFHN